jgi:hypothetical protein
LWAAQQRAKKKGFPCTITVDDIRAVMVDVCPVLGIPLEMSRDRKAKNSPSLDKIIPELGYVPGNIQVISSQANIMKADASFAELRRFARWVNECVPDESE